MGSCAPPGSATFQGPHHPPWGLGVDREVWGGQGWVQRGLSQILLWSPGWLGTQTLLPQPPVCWDYKGETPSSSTVVIFDNPLKTQLYKGGQLQPRKTHSYGGDAMVGLEWKYLEGDRGSLAGPRHVEDRSAQETGQGRAQVRSQRAKGRRLCSTRQGPIPRWGLSVPFLTRSP
jgi:hypothetical protein